MRKLETTEALILPRDLLLGAKEASLEISEMLAEMEDTMTLSQEIIRPWVHTGDNIVKQLVGKISSLVARVFQSHAW